MASSLPSDTPNTDVLSEARARLADGNETYSTDAPECPYCGYKQGHDGGYFYDENLTETECARCDRTFEVDVYTSTSWTCRPKDAA